MLKNHYDYDYDYNHMELYSKTKLIKLRSPTMITFISFFISNINICSIFFHHVNY